MDLPQSPKELDYLQESSLQHQSLENEIDISNMLHDIGAFDGHISEMRELDFQHVDLTVNNPPSIKSPISVKSVFVSQDASATQYPIPVPIGCWGFEITGVIVKAGVASVTYPIFIKNSPGAVLDWSPGVLGNYPVSNIDNQSYRGFFSSNGIVKSRFFVSPSEREFYLSTVPSASIAVVIRFYCGDPDDTLKNTWIVG